MMKWTRRAFIKCSKMALFSVSFVSAPLLLIKCGAEVVFYIRDLKIFHWVDDDQTYGPLLGGGKIGFRQMAPLIGEYANLKVHEVSAQV